MWKSLPFKECIYFSLVVNILVAVLVLILKPFLPPVVPFFYGLPTGSEQLIGSYGLFIAPATGIILTILNISISNVISNLFLKKAIVISSAFVSLLLSVTVVKVILLVGFF